MYTIEQKTDYQWEPIPEGDFQNVDDAIEAANDIMESLDWENLRIVGSEGDVHVYGNMPNTNEAGWYFSGYSA